MRKFGLMSILFVLFAISLFGEKIPVQDGAGFDGEFYRRVAENFSGDFWNSGYDAFRIQRIFPFCAVHYGFKLFHIATTHANLMHAMLGLHCLNLLLQVFLFFRISKILQWKPTTEILLLAFFFMNFFTLKNCGYEPFQSDAFAVSLSLFSLYFYLKREKFGNLGIALLGAITWPLITLQCIFLVAFDKPFMLEKEEKMFPGKLSLLYSIFAILVIVALNMTGHAIVVTNLLMRNANPVWTIVSLLCISGILFGVFRSIPRIRGNFDAFKKIWDWKFLALSILIWAVVKIFLKFHTNEELFSSNSIFALQILLRPLKYPLISFVGHVSFYGILPILIAFTFRDFVKAFVKRSAGFALIFGLTLVFSLDSESRHLATLIPLLLLPLGEALNKWNLGRFQTGSLVGIQLLLSHFYVPINSENILQEFETGNWMGMAVQRYFMNFGAYMCLESYLLWLGISVVATLVCYGILKNQIKTKSGNS